MKLNSSLARQFLSALYGNFYFQNEKIAYLEVRGKREGKSMTFRRFYRNPEALLKDMARWNPALNFWIGVALRRDTKGGKKENLLALTAAFTDVDVGTAGHKGTTSYKDKPEARAAIESFPLRPSILIDSGGGFQCYWLYQEPVRLSETKITQVEGVNRGLAQALAGDVAATDAPRILRLPGTFNLKLAGNPRSVKIVWYEPERLYDLATFVQYEVQPKPHNQESRSARHGKVTPAPGGEYEAYAQRALADEIAKLSGAHEPGRNNQLNKSAKALGELVGAGVLERGSVEAALYGVAVSIGLGEIETRGTIKSGLEAGMKEPRKLPEKNARAANQVGARANGGAGAPQGPKDGEPKRIWWVGHCYFEEHGRLCLETCDRQGVPQTRPLANFKARLSFPGQCVSTNGHCS